MRVNNASNVMIVNNTINALETGNGTAHGIDVTGTSSNVLISGNTIIVRSAGAFALGIQMFNTAGARIAGNTLSASGGTTINRAIGVNDNATVLPDSTGNTRAAGACDVSGSPTGRVEFADGTHCP